MKFIRPFYAVPPGEFYPKMYEVGEDCPEGLEASAIGQEAVDGAGDGDDEKAKSDKPAKSAKKK